MTAPVVKPELPYSQEIPGGLQPGKICRIQGITHLHGRRFDINLQAGPNFSPREKTGLHISVRLYQGYIARNSFQDGTWQDEEGTGVLPFGTGQIFEILILVEPSVYKIAINGKHFCDFAHRIPYKDLTHLSIVRDAYITLTSWEASVPILTETLTLVQKVPEEKTELQAGTQRQTEYALPPSYVSVCHYSSPTVYRPPSVAETEPDSHLKVFLELAQEALTEAIKRAAAENMLMELLLSYESGQQDLYGSGYVLQNAKYGVYSPDQAVYQSGRGSQEPQQHLEGLLALRSIDQSEFKQTENNPSRASTLEGLLASTNINETGNLPRYYGNSNPPQNFTSAPPYAVQDPLNENIDNMKKWFADTLAAKKQASPRQQQYRPDSQHQNGLYPDVKSQPMGLTVDSQSMPGYLAISGQQFCDFLHKTPYNQVTNLLANIPMILMSWNSSTPALAEALFGRQSAQCTNSNSQAESNLGYMSPRTNQQDIKMDCLREILSYIITEKNQTTEQQ